MKKRKFLIGNVCGIAALSAIMVTVNILALTTFKDDISIFLGGSGLKTDDVTGDALAHGIQVGRDIEGEGMVLLKNKDNVLPLGSANPEEDVKVNVFGYNTINVFYGGSGSGASAVDDAVDLLGAYKQSHIAYNQDIIDLMKNNASSVDSDVGNPLGGTFYPGIPELTVDKYQANVEAYKQYSDTAIINIGRTGGEGQDIPGGNTGEFKNKSGKGTEADYLALSDNEKDLIKFCEENFSKVIVCLNVANAMDTQILDDDGVDAVLWYGHPGSYALTEVGKALRGVINPSGRMVDTWAYNNKEQPSTYNATAYYTQTYTNSKSSYYVDYQEGIYVGYRYYETKYLGDEGAYQAHVQYPFGYGLSYTTFSWNVKNKTVSLSDSKATFEVEVTNTGSVAGKDVVELYYTAPYTKGGIEKSAVNLADFAKTGLLEPGANETVKLEVDLSDMASYDYNDKNNDGHKGYELEKGEYEFSFCSDAHTKKVESYTYNLASQINFDKSSTGYEIKNQFNDSYYEGDFEFITRDDNFVSNFPSSEKKAARTASQTVLDVLGNQTKFGEDDDPNAADIVTGTITKEYNKEKRDDKGEIVKDADGNIEYEMTVDDDGNETIAKRGVYLSDMAGLDYDDPLWEDLLNQMTLEEINDLICLGGYQTNAVESINKGTNRDLDGPQGFNFSNVSIEKIKAASYPSEIVVASTFSKDLAFEEGKAFGLEGNEMGVTGIYAPAVNIHRSAYGGRNFEYYSEDPVLSGYMGAKFVEGANTQGLNCFVKHFALNDQEHQRYGLITYANEQAIREIYLRPFKMTVELGKTRCIMSSFNRIGATWAGAHYGLLTEVLRNEWGFKGMVLTDYYMSYQTFMDINKGIRAGNDCWLTGLPFLRGNADLTSNASKQYARKACKNILYAVANAKATNVTLNDDWLKWFIPVDITIWVLIAAWLVLVLVVYFRSAKKENIPNTETKGE